MQTHKSFKDKWAKNGKNFFSDLLNESSEITQWVLNRNGFKNFEELGRFLNSKKRILDAGCGNGRILNLFCQFSKTQMVGIDFSSSPIAIENLKKYDNVTIHEGNLRKSLESFGRFDYIYCQEVLHHTGNAEESFGNLVNILEDNGQIAIYVYKKKAPIREFADDLIRDKIKDLSYEDAIKVNEAITQLGKVLSEVKQKISVPDVPVLGITGGEYDVQRFIYHHFLKCFWNSGLTEHENVVINYDWYHPEDCTRHTIEEVSGWFLDRNLDILHKYEDPYGITMIGKKRHG